MSYPIKGECRNTGRTRLKKGHPPTTGCFKKGFTPWNKGTKGLYKQSEETKIKRGLYNYSKEKCHLWKGGISFEPYSLDWTRTLRRSIRERDHYTCQLCGALQSDRAFDCHHKDYYKSNCDPENLILLCHPCHTKTNNNREYWKKYFSNLIEF